jgi:tetratricopeptide (TPR) repeat protein
MKSKLLAALLLVSMHAAAQGSYISRLWNTKSYDKIIEFASKSETLSGRDNMIIGRAFMATIPSQPQQALIHYDLAVQKRMNSEDLYFFRSEALYELKRLDAALADLEKCLEFRKNHQKYLLFKAAIQYEKGDLNHAYETYYTISELYDKQTPFYMLAVISLEREKYYKAREWIDANMLRFESGKDFWRMTAEQQVDTEWRIWKDYEKAQKTQDALLSYFPDNASYLKNRLKLYRLQGMDSLGVWAENDLLRRYNENKLPLDYYKKGSIKVGEYFRDRGVVEDYLTFRPVLFENTKYARFYISETGNIIGKHWAGLLKHPQDSTKRIWDFHRGDARYIIPANDTSYLGFTDLFEAPDSLFFNYDDFFILQSDSNAVDSIEISSPEILQEAPLKLDTFRNDGIPMEDSIIIPERNELRDSAMIRRE